MFQKFLVLFIATIIAFPAMAENLGSYRAALSELNKMNPLQNPEYQEIDDILNRDLQDNTNKVFGEVSDYLVSRSGKFKVYVTEIDGLMPGNQTLFLDQTEIQNSKTSSAFELPYHRDEMAELLPEFLARTATAAGEDNLTSLRSLKGRYVKLPDGKTFAKVKTAVTDKNARKIIGLVLANIAGASRSGTIAVPYNQGIQVKNKGFGTEFEIKPEYAEAVQAFAK